MNTHIVLIGDIWHQRSYGTRTTLCGIKVDPDVSPGIVQRVFERLREGKTDERCFDCERVWESGLQPEEFWETHERTGEPLGDRKPVKLPFNRTTDSLEALQPFSGVRVT